MASAWISLCVTALVVAVTVAESPGSNGGFGGGGMTFATPGSQGIRYAGPIVYTNEKPPVIHFPPPPRHSENGVGGFGGGNGFGKSQPIKYIPLPHHDLPVLIYQSDISPPIHVVQNPNNPPQPGPIPQPKSQNTKSEFGSQHAKSEFGSQNTLTADYSSPPKQYTFRPQQHQQQHQSTKYIEYDPISTDYSTQSKNVYKPSPRPPPRQQQYSSSSHSYVPKGYSPGLPKGYSPGPPKGYNPGSFEQYTSQSKNQYRTYKPSSSHSHSYKYSDLFGSGSAPPTTRTEYDSKPKYENHPPKSSPSPLPHIIYAGHPPIHIFQQPPIYMSAPKQVNSQYEYTTATKTHYSSPTKTEYLYTSESSPPRTVYQGPPKPTSSSYGHGSSSPPKFIEYNHGPPPRPKHNNHNHNEYRPSPKPTFRPTPTTFGPSSPPKYTEFRSSPKPEYHRNPTSRPSKPEYHRNPTSRPSKLEYGRQKADYSTQSAVYVKPQNDYTSSGSYSYGPPKSDYYRPPKIWSNGYSTSSSYNSPIKYKTSKKVTYSPAPKNWNKPPIIIYQGVKPPVHMFENVVSFDSVITDGGPQSNFATRRISGPGIDVDPRNSFNSFSNNNNGFMNPNPTMWIPAYPAPNGYQTTLYVSDLTSAGAAPLLATAAPTESSNSTTIPETTTAPIESQTAEVPIPDWSESSTPTTTTQVTITDTQADAEKEAGNTDADKISSADDTDLLPTHFLAADVNNQNTPLTSIPMSYSSFVVQHAGSQPYRVI